MKTRICKKCKVEQSINEFQRNYQCVDHRVKTCKKCLVAQQMASNKEAILIRKMNSKIMENLNGGKFTIKSHVQAAINFYNTNK